MIGIVDTQSAADGVVHVFNIKLAGEQVLEQLSLTTALTADSLRRARLLLQTMNTGPATHWRSPPQGYRRYRQNRGGTLDLGHDVLAVRLQWRPRSSASLMMVLSTVLVRHRRNGHGNYFRCRRNLDQIGRRRFFCRRRRRS